MTAATVRMDEVREPEVKLTPSQIAVLQWLAHGKRNEDIALLMNLPSQHAVQAHIQRICTAIGTNSRTAAVAWALRRKLII